MSKNWGKGLSQEDFMIKDECILLDEDDNIIGHANKKDSHVFNKKQPRGLLHRAFSVFLFNEEGKLLLQKRAIEKVTFPSVWTNTCCSHPLYGFDPNEVDQPDAVARGEVDGVKNAAIRKLEHELGISSKKLSPDDFKFLTRLHYWAADVVTHGPNSPWGEHEIDYILFIKKDVKIKPNAEEVGDTKYVTLEELQEMMKPDNGKLWSPWFRIIAEKFLVHWWKDLNKTLTTDAFVDYRTIYRFDPTEEHMGGAGNAGKYLGTATYPKQKELKPQAVRTDNGAIGTKQGGYGKIKIHGSSTLDQLSRIDEVFSALYFKYWYVMPNKVVVKDDNFKFCDDMLGKVSRSFSSVIRQLPKGLCTDILLFYLALRALDTIEDDMEFWADRREKIEHLTNFYRTGLVTDGWSMEGVGRGDERVLLSQYYRCVAVFKSLSPTSQEIIADITRRMGEGMAQFVGKDLGEGTVTVEEYNKYCHFVAGLVGEGLTRLFAATGYESADVNKVSTTLANTMGLFLQKVNIIRDYLEDYYDARTFWPQQIWKQYSATGELGYFANPKTGDAKAKALHCLNHMVTDALSCVPECLQYMDLLKTEEVFRFCAIPQVMAIATLAELYGNPKVFTGVVKIRKGQAAQLILDTTTVGGLHKWFYLCAQRIDAAINSSDPSSGETRRICRRIMDLTEKHAKIAIWTSYAAVVNYAAIVLLIVSAFFLFGVSTFEQGKFSTSIFTDVFSAEHHYQGRDKIMVLVFMLCLSVMFIYSMIEAAVPKLKKADL